MDRRQQVKYVKTDGDETGGKADVVPAWKKLSGDIEKERSVVVGQQWCVATIMVGVIWETAADVWMYWQTNNGVQEKERELRAYKNVWYEKETMPRM